MRVEKIRACLKSSGIVDSLRQILIRRVIGSRSALGHDLMSFVGRESSEQVESDIDKIAAFTSDSVARAKVERVGGTLTGNVCGRDVVRLQRRVLFGNFVREEFEEAIGKRFSRADRRQ